MKISRFQDLEIWKMSVDVALDIYKLTGNKNFSKDFGLRDQVRRAVISISSNIAEGFEINNNNDLIRFLRIAKGSSGELRSQLYISFKLKYIRESGYKKIDERLELLSSKIGKFITYLSNKRKEKEFLTR